MSGAAVLLVGAIFLLISYVLRMVEVLALFTLWGEETFGPSDILSLDNGSFICFDMAFV
jgi:hypothetical protein